MLPKKGFTIVEFLIAMLMSAVIISAVFVTYISLLKGYKQEGEIARTQMNDLINFELLRKDIQVAGLGIDNSTVSPVIYDATVPIHFTINTTLDFNNTSTGGYNIYQCSGGSWTILSSFIADNNTLDNKINVILMDQSSGGTADNASCIGTEIGIGFPSNSTTANNYSSIRYGLGPLNTGDTVCAKDTRSLQRDVDAGTAVTLSDCIAGLDVYFGMDTTGNGAVDSYITGAAFNLLTPGVQNQQLKSIKLYLASQVGGFDKEYAYGSTTVAYSIPGGAAGAFDISGILSNANYRWEVIEVESKTYNVRN